MKSIKKKIEFGYLYYDKKDKEFIPYNYDHSGSTMNVYHEDVTKEMVEKAHKNNIPVMIWMKFADEESDKDYKKLLELGVDCICCNQPDKAKKYRDNIFYKNNK